MNKVNYNKQMKQIIGAIPQGTCPDLLLHACCAPCASGVLPRLIESFDVTLFFYNPNVTDKEEFDKRLYYLRSLIKQMSAESGKSISVIVPPYNPQEFFDCAKGLETLPEGGLRCDKCFRLRLGVSAEYANTHGFGYFATTLTVSPYKNADLINSIGLSLSSTSVYLPSDFKKDNGYDFSIAQSKKYSLYRQEYCGCCFSLEQSAKGNI